MDSGKAAPLSGSGSSFCEQPVHGDDHPGKGKPEVDDRLLTLGTPHQILMAFCQEFAPSTTQRFVAAIGASIPFFEI